MFPWSNRLAVLVSDQNWYYSLAALLKTPEMLLVVLAAMVERSLILLEEHVLRIQQQSFKNLKTRIVKGKLMRQQHEQQQRQLLQVDLVALLGQREMVVKLLRQSQLGKEQSLIGHLLGWRKLLGGLLVVREEKEALVVVTVVVSEVAVVTVVVGKENVAEVVMVDCLTTDKEIAEEEEAEAVAVAVEVGKATRVVVLERNLPPLVLLLLLLHHHLVLLQLLVMMQCLKQKLATPMTCLAMNKYFPPLFFFLLHFSFPFVN
jgi:hypothetical protein